MDCDSVGLRIADFWTDNSAIVQTEGQDRFHLAPRVCRFFNAYLDADTLRRAGFRKAVAYASHCFKFNPDPSLQEDITVAFAIEQDAADLACAIDCDEMIDDLDLGLVDFSLVADSYATLALGYRSVLGYYCFDPVLSELGEVAVRLILMSESEYDSAFAATRTSLRLYCENAFGPSISISPTRNQAETAESSLELISRRLKDQILLRA
jgi:hypothetical protein